MSSNMERAAAMRAAFDRIEESYEFMLAYAAQGRKTDADQGGNESQIRQYLNRLASALNDLQNAWGEGYGDNAGQEFGERFMADLMVVRSVISFLQNAPDISSEMVDNTNGLIALRAFLTDVFFVDQAVLPRRQA